MGELILYPSPSWEENYSLQFSLINGFAGLKIKLRFSILGCSHLERELDLCIILYYILLKTREYGAHARTVPKSSRSIQPMRGPLALSNTPLQQEAGGNTAVIILGVKLTGTGNGWGFPLVPVVFATSPS